MIRVGWQLEFLEQLRGQGMVFGMSEFGEGSVEEFASFGGVVQVAGAEEAGHEADVRSLVVLGVGIEEEGVCLGGVGMVAGGKELIADGERVVVPAAARRAR